MKWLHCRTSSNKQEVSRATVVIDLSNSRLPVSINECLATWAANSMSKTSSDASASTTTLPQHPRAPPPNEARDPREITSEPTLVIRAAHRHLSNGFEHLPCHMLFELLPQSNPIQSIPFIYLVFYRYLSHQRPHVHQHMTQ